MRRLSGARRVLNAFTGLPSRVGRLAVVVLALVGLLATSTTPANAETLRDRFQASLQALQKPGKLTRQHGGAMLHWHLSEAQRLFSDVRIGRKALLPVAQKLSQSSKVPWLQGEALGTLASLSFTSDPAAARKALQGAGVLDRAWVLGPLPSPGTNAGTSLGDALDLKKVVAGVRAPMGWRWVQDAALVGAFQLGDVLDVDGDAHAWVVVAVDVAKPVDAMVVLGSNGPLYASLDGQKLVSWDGERALSDWQHAFPVRLEAGRHRLALRVGHRTDAPELIARIVDKRGRLPQGVTVVKADGRTTATFAPSKKLPKAISDLAGVDPAVAGRVLLYVKNTPDARREAALQFEKALTASPKSAELHYLLGRAERADANRAREAFEKAVKLSGGKHAAALGHLLPVAESARLSAHADSLARQLAKVDPEHPGYLTYWAMRTAELGDPVSALAWLARQKAPAQQARLLLARAELSESADRPLQAARTWELFSRVLAGRHHALVRAVRLARRAGRSDQAGAWLVAASGQAPWAIWPVLVRAQVLNADAKRPGAALALLKTLEQRHPDSAELFQLRGQILLEKGDKTGAVAAFDRSLELKPQNQSLAERRRGMVSRRSLAQRFAEPADTVIKASEEEPPSHTGATYLLDKQVVRVHDSGLSSRFTQRIIRIDAAAATERFETMSFSFTPGQERLQIVQAEVIHADGTRSRPKAVTTRRPRGKTNGVYTLGAYRVIRFSNLRVDDVVHVQVTSDEVGERNLFGSFFGVFFPVQSGDYARQVVRMIDAPSGRKLFAHGRGVKAPKRTVDTKSGRQTLTWNVRDVPAIPIERGMPGYGDIAWYANVSTYDSWKALADWYRELVRPQLTMSPKLQTLARSLVKGKSTVRDKVAAIQNWVVKNTRYVGIEFGIHGFKPYKVTQVVERAYGDCKDKASLIIAMLGEVGVHAEFVLVRTRDLGRLEGKPATLWAFNHAIAYVPALDTYIDGTSEFAGLGEVPALDQGAMILRVSMKDDSPPVLTQLPYRPAAENLVVSKGTVTLAADGSASLDASETIAGTQAPQIRRIFHDASRRKQRLSALLSQQYRGATLKSSNFTHLDALGKPVTVALTANLPSFAEKTDAGLTVPLDPTPDAIMDRYGKYGERLQPLVLDYPVTERGQTSVVLPKGGKVVQKPGPVSLSSPFGSFKLTVSTRGNTVNVDEELVLNATQVKPGDYAAFRGFVQKIATARAAVVKVQITK